MTLKEYGESLGFVGQTSRRQITSESVRERLSLAGLDCRARSVFGIKIDPVTHTTTKWYE